MKFAILISRETALNAKTEVAGLQIVEVPVAKLKLTDDQKKALLRIPRRRCAGQPEADFDLCAVYRQLPDDLRQEWWGYEKAVTAPEKGQVGDLALQAIRLIEQAEARNNPTPATVAVPATTDLDAGIAAVQA